MAAHRAKRIRRKPNRSIELLSAKPSAPCAIAVAGTSQALQLGGGCTLYVNNPIVAFPLTSDAAGFARLMLPLAPLPSLRAVTVRAQGFVVDPLGAFSGLAMTGGWTLIVGD